MADVRRTWALLVSMRLTAAILTALGALLLLNVLVPQADTSPAAFAALLRRGPLARVALVTLGLGHVSTSPLLIAALGIFFVQLACVLLDRAATTVRRIRFAPPTAPQLQALLDGPARIECPLPPGFGGGWAVTVLQRLGYRAVRLDERSVWGLKNRMALLGFPVFHLSFFVLCAGALQIFLTRDVITLSAAEGQTVDAASGSVVRRAPLGAPRPPRLSLDKVHVRLEDGKPVDLAATIRLEGPAAIAQTSRVNHPLRSGDLSVLVEDAGVAPVLWLRDAHGYTVDRVAVITASRDGSPTRLSIGRRLEVAVAPISIGDGFPERAEMAGVPISLEIREGEQRVFGGRLRPGEIFRAGDWVLELEEVRYWVGVRLVRERGGALLVAGFLLAVTGLVWRMLWFRREVGIGWDGARIRLAGRGELFPARFREELEAIRGFLCSPGGAGGAGRSPPP